jgi:hypothetical protein
MFMSMPYPTCTDTVPVVIRLWQKQFVHPCLDVFTHEQCILLSSDKPDRVLFLATLCKLNSVLYSAGALEYSKGVPVVVTGEGFTRSHSFLTENKCRPDTLPIFIGFGIFRGNCGV